MEGRVQYLGESKCFHVPLPQRIQLVEYGQWYKFPLQLCRKLWYNNNFQPDEATLKMLNVNEENVTGLWKGEDIFIVASGSSLKEFDYVLHLKDKKTIVINHSVGVFPQASALMFMDARFTKERKQEIREFKGLIFASMKSGYDRQDDKVLQYATNYHEPQSIFNYGLYGKRTTLCAINLALLMTDKNVYLLGMDLDYNSKEQFSSSKGVPDKNFKYDNEELCKERIKEFDVYESYKDRIYNCNANSGVRTFKFKSIEEAL